ncbi:hypothetical protein CR969_00355 [Candidatus Saccharibacteria bacterium]|nr:MAG: hypothetical protein CR969_00355 [Candidatus Saccharibacteria bacterium]
MTDKPEKHDNKAKTEVKAEPQPAQVSQPVTQQPGAQPQPAQYVVMQQSTKGIGGWLIFWMVMFGLAAITYIYSFFGAMTVLHSANGIVALIFSPILAVGYIAAVVAMSMEKKISKLITWASLGVSAIYSVIASIVYYITSSHFNSRYDYISYSYSRDGVDVDSLPMLIAFILVSLVLHGLVALYFVLSRRVKETLVK